MSRYGTLITWANELGLETAPKLLKQTLGEEKETDKTLTEIAETVVSTRKPRRLPNKLEKLRAWH